MQCDTPAIEQNSESGQMHCTDFHVQTDIDVKPAELNVQKQCTRASTQEQKHQKGQTVALKAARAYLHASDLYVATSVVQLCTRHTTFWTFKLKSKSKAGRAHKQNLGFDAVASKTTTTNLLQPPGLKCASQPPHPGITQHPRSKLWAFDLK